MKSAVAEITRISHLLPPRKKAQLLDFARALQVLGCSKLPGPRAVPARSGSQDSPTFWISDHSGVVLRAASRDGSRSAPPTRPKLTTKLKRLTRLAAEGRDEPMDWDRL